MLRHNLLILKHTSSCSPSLWQQFLFTVDQRLLMSPAQRSSRPTSNIHNTFYFHNVTLLRETMGKRIETWFYPLAIDGCYTSERVRSGIITFRWNITKAIFSFFRIACTANGSFKIIRVNFDFMLTLRLRKAQFSIETRQRHTLSGVFPPFKHNHFLCVKRWTWS